MCPWIGILQWQKNWQRFGWFLTLKIDFHRRIPIQWHIFCYWHFLIKSIFKSLYLLKWCPIFDSSPLIQNPKFNNFLWICWFAIFLILYPPFENSTTRIAISATTCTCKQIVCTLDKSIIWQAKQLQKNNKYRYR